MDNFSQNRPRRGGEPRNSESRAVGGSRANTLAIVSPLGDSPNYVVLPRVGGRRAPPAASHTTCMGADILFCDPREAQNSKMFRGSTLKY